MIINEIQLTNIGAYKETNSFNLRPENGKNVILIGGENGAGKTTLLNAIKLGLFGSYGYGFKTENAEYFKRVQSILNHNAKKNNENNFRIKLDFSLIDNFEKTDYVLRRHWKFSNNNLKETLDLSANGKYLSEYEKEIFQSKLKEIMPPQLLDLCLFDGEEIARIVNEDLLSEYLQNLSKVVFNLDLFEILENDLESYSNQSVDVRKMEESEQTLYDSNLREKELRKKIVSAISDLKELNLKKDALNDEYQQLKDAFEKYGGLVKSERDQIVKQMNSLENIRKQNLEKIKGFVANLLPFYLTKGLLTDARQQIQNEESLQLFKQLDTKLTDDKISDVLHSLNGSFEDNAGETLKAHLLKLVKPEKEISSVHGASFSESSLIENMFLTISGTAHQECLDIIKDNKEKLTELQKLRERLKINDTTNEFSDMIQRMETTQQAILKLEDELNSRESQLEDWKSELEVITSTIDKIQGTLKDSEKTKSSFIESQKIITLSRRFREIQLKKKLQQVQIEATTMLKRILRKHNYISSIVIDHKTYDVSLLDSQKDYVEKSTLSAGEKEILLISIIWAIFKCSGRKVPFIFDTLLGRLDKTHKAAVLKEFIPNCGRQAIILSTDTEIDENNYKILEDSVTKEYMLEFNVERKETQILNQYFPFRQTGVNL
ncbi:MULTISPECIES: DNA sulfur modification protein DndD [Priestia]|jgi:DNA sulfur modification protein DndD|uniref:DNA sulfur modification protein DndD n=1 Tax=Priestia TaxID=2800373 RepID=UPI001592FE2F|nr:MULTISPECIES: DNA sulfur modification protein DndD [Priestia]MDE8673618.1 DNA sulfur modification protein DndD [Priestia aryabhattai]QSF36780.1 DNA sulfur modification protein DndD [Priestia megaterium]